MAKGIKEGGIDWFISAWLYSFVKGAWFLQFEKN